MSLLLPLALFATQAAPTQDKPEEPRGLLLTSPEASPGYTLFAPLGTKETFLVDLEGRVVHKWTSELMPSSVYLCDDGSILRHERVEPNKVFAGGGICGRISRVNWDGKEVWSYSLASEDQTTHHDARMLPNGNVLVIVWEYRYREDALAFGRDPEHVSDKGLWPDALLEIKPTLPEGGEVVWEWHAFDHLVQDHDREAMDYGDVAAHPGRIDINYDHHDVEALSAEELAKQKAIEEEMQALGYSGGDDEDEEEDPAPGAAPVLGGLQGPNDGHGSDWMHTNTVDYDPVRDLIVLSSPHLNEVWIIDHSTTTEQAAGKSGGKHKKGGDLLWRWGNPKNYRAGTKADQRLFYQHDVQFIPPGHPGAGNLLVFNNGQGSPAGDHSIVFELVLPFDPLKGFVREGATFGPKEPVWKFAAPDLYAAFISGCQRLPNGNTLVIEGPEGRIFEVTPAGKLVWDYRNTHGTGQNAGGAEGHALFRARRYAPDHPAFRGRTLTPIE
jgi:hypothetical protein